MILAMLVQLLWGWQCHSVSPPLWSRLILGGFPTLPRMPMHHQGTFSWLKPCITATIIKLNRRHRKSIQTLDIYEALAYF